MNSWFSTKSEEATHSGVPIALGEEPINRSFPAFTTPHDAILAELHAQQPNSTEDDKLNDSPYSTQVYDKTQPDIRVNDTPLSVAQSYSTSHTDHRRSLEILYDPFDGTPIGPLMPQRSIHGHSSPVEGTNNNEELWSHLSRILDLQGQIAKMHVDMEGIGSKSGDGKGKGVKPSRREWEERKDGEVKGGLRTAGETDGGAEDEHEGDEEGVGIAGNEEEETNKAREEEFAKLADQFDGRKESVNEIMDKLEGLSKALTAFHALQTPKIEFASSSRNNSVAVPVDPPPRPFIRPPAVTTSTLPNVNGGIIPVSLSRSAPPRHTPVASLIVNGDESGSQTHVVESPVSMIGSFLPHEE